MYIILLLLKTYKNAMTILNAVKKQAFTLCFAVVSYSFEEIANSYIVFFQICQLNFESGKVLHDKQE